MSFMHCIGCGIPLWQDEHSAEAVDGICARHNDDCTASFVRFAVARGVDPWDYDSSHFDITRPEVLVLIDQWLEQRVNTPPAPPSETT